MILSNSNGGLYLVFAEEDFENEDNQIEPLDLDRKTIVYLHAYPVIGFSLSEDNSIDSLISVGGTYCFSSNGFIGYETAILFDSKTGYFYSKDGTIDLEKLMSGLSKNYLVYPESSLFSLCPTLKTEAHTGLLYEKV